MLCGFRPERPQVQEIDLELFSEDFKPWFCPRAL